VRGWKVEHWLNGKKIIALDLASPEGKAAIAASKFKDWPKFASLSRGYIALQDHGNVVSFRLAQDSGAEITPPPTILSPSRSQRQTRGARVRSSCL